MAKIYTLLVFFRWACELGKTKCV